MDLGVRSALGVGCFRVKPIVARTRVEEGLTSDLAPMLHPKLKKTAQMFGCFRYFAYLCSLIVTCRNNNNLKTNRL